MNENKIFGTDGIRREVSDFSLDFLLHLGQVIGHWILQMDQNGIVLIGRDTRRSGEMMESALAAGLLSQGVDVISLGVIPTSGVAYLTRETGSRLGIVLSGSHNSPADNGIKFFNEQGFKTPEAVETEIEELLCEARSYPATRYDKLGRLEPGSEYVNNYVEHLIASWRGRRNLANLKVIVDCVNGATYQIGPEVFRRLGAEVVVLNNKPDGININPDYDTESYESHMPARVSELVIREQADLGIGFDGDGDRVLLVDEQGNYIDGDQMLAMLTRDMKKRDLLDGNTVVTTIMRNLGLDMALQDMQVNLEVTPVGDKHVAEKMVQNGYVLGGEQSGHIIIFQDGQTTGDGIYAALRIASLLVNSGQPLSNLAGIVHKFPQKIEHVRNVPLRESTDRIPGLAEQIEKSENILSRSGPKFINVRYSGTEKGLVRVTVKGMIQKEVEQEAYNIASAIERWKTSANG